MQIKKISTQFSLNYIFILFIIFALVISAYVFNTSYQNNYIYSQFIDLDQFYEDYTNTSLRKAILNQNFTENDFIEILDSNYEIIESYNSTNKVGYKYSQADFLNKLSSDDIFNYYSYIPVDKEIYIFLYIEQVSLLANIYMFLIVFVIVLSLVSVVAFSKYSANKIVIPIKELVKGVNRISDGSYNTPIEFTSSNELEILKDEINSMASKLSFEIDARKRIEQNEKQLIANISHDIKTPLTNIIGYSQTLLENKSLDKESVDQSLEIIHYYGKFADKLVSELFEFSKLEMTNNTLPVEELDIIELIRVKLIEYINEFDSKSITYNFDLPEHPVLLSISQIHFLRAFDNIIQNSIKYNQSNFTINVSVKDDKDKLLIFIEDDGIGIDTKFHKTIFEPLTRVESSRNRELGGSGLGLSISKNIFAKHNAILSIDTEYIDGCRFLIEFKKDHIKL